MGDERLFLATTFQIEQHPAVLRTAAFASRPIRPALRSELEALQSPGADELARAALAANALSDAST